MGLAITSNVHGNAVGMLVAFGYVRNYITRLFTIKAFMVPSYQTGMRTDALRVSTETPEEHGGSITLQTEALTLVKGDYRYIIVLGCGKSSS